MSSKILNTITNTSLVSRHDHLAVCESFTIDSAIHADGEKIVRGTVFGKQGSGKYRAYAEALVKSAFANNSTAFQLDMTSPAAKHFRVGDVIQGTDGTALGTIATFDPTTGNGTLTANATNNFAANGTNAVRIPLATVALASKAVRILKDEVQMIGTDEIGVGYFEGFFVESTTTLTAAAETAIGAIKTDTDEVRI